MVKPMGPMKVLKEKVQEPSAPEPEQTCSFERRFLSLRLPGFAVFANYFFFFITFDQQLIGSVFFGFSYQPHHKWHEVSEIHIPTLRK
ncbi:hypothetical protein MANES_07G022251v8 [Manihot esculenta]|uniref:Uncharacterized protein n=1 Tax=Manihot esculenta TaxID=3983 RepID=A0ACB7HCV9_MANES|nr:hypothetical protein MANES_07G022251v8 [Manihot esculenta]